MNQTTDAEVSQTDGPYKKLFLCSRNSGISHATAAHEESVLTTFISSIFLSASAPEIGRLLAQSGKDADYVFTRASGTYTVQETGTEIQQHTINPCTSVTPYGVTKSQLHNLTPERQEPLLFIAHVTFICISPRWRASLLAIPCRLIGLWLAVLRA